MGCHSRTSNFQAYIYDAERQSWGCAWGMDLTFEAPTRELVVQGIEEWSSLPLDEWSIVETDKGTWQAVQLNPVPELSART